MGSARPSVGESRVSESLLPRLGRYPARVTAVLSRAQRHVRELARTVDQAGVVQDRVRTVPYEGHQNPRAGHRTFHEVAQVVGVLPGGELVGRFDADLAQHPVGHLVQGAQDRAGQPHEGAHRDREQGGRGLRVGDGPGLGCHLTDCQVQEGHDQELEHVTGDVGCDRAQASRLEQGRQPVVDRRLGDGAQG